MSNARRTSAFLAKYSSIMGGGPFILRRFLYMVFFIVGFYLVYRIRPPVAECVFWEHAWRERLTALHISTGPPRGSLYLNMN